MIGFCKHGNELSCSIKARIICTIELAVVYSKLYLCIAFASATSFDIHMCCKVYCSALQRLPALVRQWWSELEPRVASLVEQVTSVHCAPLLCAQEMKVIQSKDMHHGNMLVINTTENTDQGSYKCLGGNKLGYF